MEDLIAFRKMITPTIIRVVFWIAVVICLYVGIKLISTGANARYGGGQYVMQGIAWCVLGPLLARIYCEILIVVFMINDSLADIRSTLKNR